MRALALRVARVAPAVVGSTGAFLLTLALTAAWIAVGPFAGFTDGWLLVPSAVASIAALLLVVLLQYSQNRDTRAVQLKLDELISSLSDARTQLVRLEHLPDEELDRIEQEFDRIRGRQTPDPG